MKKLIFEASLGYFGEHGYVKISFWKWLYMVFESGYVLRIRRIKKRKKKKK